MIICRTPFRISFFGGGTDYPVWYKEHGGAVLSTTIDKYCYVSLRHLPPFFDFNYRIRYYIKEEKKELDDIQHPSVRECLRFMNIERGVEVVHSADLPAQSGLGSSSTFTVCMLHALNTLLHKNPTKRELALSAINVEQKMIGESVGSQDQTSAAFGGFNRIQFGGPQEIAVNMLVLSPEVLRTLQGNLMLFFTGFSRNASEVAKEQIQKTKNKKAELFRMMEIVDEAHLLLNQGDIDSFGRLLHDQWLIKRGMASLITNNCIDGIYDAGMRAGALGGKLLGAGNGGFMLFYVRPEQQPAVKQALASLLHVPFYFESLGSQVVYFTHESPSYYHTLPPRSCS